VAGAEPSAGDGVFSALLAAAGEDACGTESPMLDGFAPFGALCVLAEGVGGVAGA
jgi:hypothetical protein